MTPRADRRLAACLIAACFTATLAPVPQRPPDWWPTWAPWFGERPRKVTKWVKGTGTEERPKTKGKP